MSAGCYMKKQMPGYPFLRFVSWLKFQQQRGPIGLMAKASDFGSEDCAFESRVGRFNFCTFLLLFVLHPTMHQPHCSCISWQLLNIFRQTTTNIWTHSSDLFPNPTSPVFFSLSSQMLFSSTDETNLSWLFEDTRSPARQVGDKLRIGSFFNSESPIP